MKFQLNEDAIIKTNYGFNKISDINNFIKSNDYDFENDNMRVIGYYNNKECLDKIIDIVPSDDIERVGLVFGRLSNTKDAGMVYDITDILGEDQILVVDGNTYDPIYLRVSELTPGQKISSINGSLELYEIKKLKSSTCYDIITENNIPSIYSNKLLLISDNTEEENKSFFKKLLQS
jgi:hypothetical protein